MYTKKETEKVDIDKQRTDRQSETLNDVIKICFVHFCFTESSGEWKILPLVVLRENKRLERTVKDSAELNQTLSRAHARGLLLLPYKTHTAHSDYAFTLQTLYMRIHDL